jgi:hypothetical protein
MIINFSRVTLLHTVRPFQSICVQKHMKVIFVYNLLQACQPAAFLALEDVNNRKDLLTGFTLKLHWNDSEVAIHSTLMSCICVNFTAS